MILEKKKIVLVGMTGVGKTTIGRVLSKILRRTFIDIDFEVEKASGQKIHHIFENYGENEFRKIEKKTLCLTSKVKPKIQLLVLIDLTPRGYHYHL